MNTSCNADCFRTYLNVHACAVSVVRMCHVRDVHLGEQRVQRIPAAGRGQQCHPCHMRPDTARTMDGR
jgi:hypothetical protein